MHRQFWLIPVAFIIGIFPPWLIANLLVYLSGGVKYDWHFAIAMIVCLFSITAMFRIIFGVCLANENKDSKND